MDKSAQVAAIEAAVVALRRSQKRRALARLARRDGERTGERTGGRDGERTGGRDGERVDGNVGKQVDGRADLPDGAYELLDVLAAAAERGEQLTVTEAAAHLDVDQPRASRLAGLALDANLIRREADQHDGRRSLLVLTANGEEVLAHIHDFRRRTIAEATKGWSDADRSALARLLPRLVRDFTALTNEAD